MASSTELGVWSLLQENILNQPEMGAMRKNHIREWDLQEPEGYSRSQAKNSGPRMEGSLLSNHAELKAQKGEQKKILGGQKW